ncbi:MAG TPA: AAA family ATPase, partial [Bacteroidales bacterium]|nr:AAA family ATPase [Bacteroidales bacterium]HQN90576.1 AAA family ATPase [Methanoregulaceae archaeon]
MHRKKRKKSNQRPVVTICATDRDEQFVIRKCAWYIKGFLDTRRDLDKETLELLLYVLGDTMDLFAVYLGGMMNSDERSDFINSLMLTRSDADDHIKVYYDAIVQFDSHAQQEILSHLQHVLDVKIEQCTCRGMSQLKKKIGLLKRLFSLNELEVELCTFILIVTFWEKMDDFFVHRLECNRFSNRNMLSRILNVERHELNRALHGTLSRISLYSLDEHNLSLSDSFMEFFSDQNSRSLKSFFYERIRPKAIPLEYHQVDARTTEHLVKLLKKKSKTPTNILIYGDPGTGKTSYAVGVAQKLGIPTYRIMPNIESHAESCRLGIAACLNMTHGGKGSLIIVDDADSTLNTIGSFSHMKGAKDKGWLNELLETKGSRIIWIANAIDQVEESVLRRFAYSMEFKPFNQRQRIMVWKTVLEANRIPGILRADQINDLAKSHKVNPGVIDMAVKKALDVSGRTEKCFHEALAMNLKASSALINGGRSTVKGAIEKNYSLDGLNMAGDIQGMLRQIRSFDRHLRSSREHAGCMNILFYGPPGTGKSELARYLGELLQREIICRRPSDILDPFVGMSERNICHMFEEAQKDEAILIVDEVDTLLFNRTGAQQSWEISMTNEFLTSLERFQGIFIGTTNMLTNLDHASIRRFHHKIGFDYLTPDGNVTFYERLLSPILAEGLS